MYQSGGGADRLRQIEPYADENQLTHIQEELSLYWCSVLNEPLPAEILMLISILERNERDDSDPVRRSM